MKKLTSTEMKSVHGGVMDYGGCVEIEADGELECCIGCGRATYCGDIEWYFRVGNNPDIC